MIKLITAIILVFLLYFIYSYFFYESFMRQVNKFIEEKTGIEIINYIDRIEKDLE